MKTMVVDQTCFGAIVGSGVEAFPRETMGFLIGKSDCDFVDGILKKVMRVTMALPLKKIEQSTTHVSISNYDSYNKTRNALDVLGFEIVGEYHSHPIQDMDWMEEVDEQRGLSGNDKKFIRGGLKTLRKHNIKQEEWLEMVVTIGRKTYQTIHPIGWTPLKSTRNRPIPPLIGGRLKFSKKLGKDVSKYGYTIIISGFRGKLKKDQLKVVRVDLRV